MKKSLFFALFLVLSSFFFISIKEVEATEMSFDISFDNINDDFFKVKSLAEDLMVEKNYKEFIIVKKDLYYVHFFKDSFESINCNIYNNNLSCYAYYQKQQYKYYNDVLSSGSSSTNFSPYDYSVFTNILYSTFTFIFKDSSNNLNLNYANTNLQVNNLDTIPLVYDLYLKSSELSDPHLGEKEVIANFYTICIEKIKYLGEQIVSNYIYLSMLVILILIFIIELIRRWLM